MSSNSPLKNPFVLLGLFSLGCVGTVIVMAILKQNAQALACRNSLELIAVLEYVPYELRADALASVVPTMNKLYDCQTTWFETDSTLREYNLFRMDVSEDGRELTGKGRAAAVLRARTFYPLEPMSTRVPARPPGLTNWVSFRIILNNPSNFDVDCLNSLDNFDFVTSDAR